MVIQPGEGLEKKVEMANNNSSSSSNGTALESYVWRENEIELLLNIFAEVDEEDVPFS